MIEKFLNNPQSFSDHELLEVLLFYAIPRRNTNEIAHRLLRTFGSLEKVFNADKQMLKSVDGVGDKVAAEIMLVSRLINVIHEKQTTPTRIANFGELYKYIQKLFENVKKVEKFNMVLLSSEFKVLTCVDFTDNIASSVSVEIPELVNAFVIHKPKYLIISHNHVSGDPKPSESDDVMTMRVNILCALHGVKLFDHLIVGKTLYSYRDKGDLDRLMVKADIHSILREIKER
jgi:DNA repair protein RadC